MPEMEKSDPRRGTAAKVEKMMLEGMRVQDIARELGISRQRVYQIITGHVHNVTTRKARRDEG
jgi:hypothetical protein